MSFDFRMIFSGLMAVIPDRRFAKTLDFANSVTILIPNLLKPRRLERAHENGEPEILDPHLPVLEIQSQDWLSASTRQADLTKPAKSLSLFLIDGEEIEILPIPALAASFKMLVDAPVNKQAPTKQEEKSLFWLATMEQASPGKGKVQTGLLTAPLDPKGPVITRIKLERGQLSTHELSKKICRFEPPGRDRFEQKVAVSLELLIEGVPQHVALAMKKNGEPVQTLVLAPPPSKPYSDGKRSEVVVNVLNLEREDILARDNPAVGPLGEEQAIADFEVFYDLAEDFTPGVDKRPFLLEIVPRNQLAITTDRPHALCPPTAMNGG